MKNRQKVDWQQLHDRLDRLGLVKTTDELDSTILQARARILAKPLEEEKQIDSTDLIKFSIANTSFAIEDTYVQEITKFFDYASLPGAPEYILGITSLRGKILPILELDKLLSLPRPGITDLTNLFVLGKSTKEFAFLAERVDQLISVPRAQINRTKPVPPSAEHPDIFLGNIQNCHVLDGQALLNDTRFYLG